MLFASVLSFWAQQPQKYSRRIKLDWYFLYYGWLIFNFSQCFVVVRGHSRPKLHPTFDPALDDLFFSKICVIKSSVNMLWMYGWLKFSKVTSGSWCFFANYLYLQSFFKKKSQNDIISSLFVLQVICFTTRIKIKNEFPCETECPILQN